MWLPSLSESNASQREQDVSAWPVVFPSVDGTLDAQRARVCVLHTGGWGLWAGFSALRYWQCRGCYSILKLVLLASHTPALVPTAWEIEVWMESRANALTGDPSSPGMGI